MVSRADGFTLVELVTIIVILGVLAVVALPRMDTSGYRSIEFHDKTVAALRFAQKTAISHRRLVCVAFPDDHTLALTIDTDKNGACDNLLPIPGAPNNQLVSSDPANAFFTPVPAALNFAADGTSAGGTISLNGANNIVVSGATGYVQ